MRDTDALNRSTTAIAIVSTSLHLLYLAELRHNLRIDFLEVVVFLKRSTDKPQIMQMLEVVSCEQLHFIDATSKMANRFVSVYEIIELKGLSLTFEQYDHGVFADYGRCMLANIKCASYYWLGDGTKIIFETSTAGRTSLSRHKLQRYAEPILSRFAGMRMQLPKPPTIFSPFNLGVVGQEENRFDWLRKRYNLAEKNSSFARKVYFFGTYFSERGGRVLMLDEHYLKYMEQVVEYFLVRGISMVYVPHRHESVEKLSLISQLPSVEVQRFTFPAELEFCERGERPLHIASFFSTCLFHFEKLALSETITSFYLNFSHHNKAYQPVAEAFYASLRDVLGTQRIVALDNVN